MDPFFHTGLSISDSLKTVRKSVLIYETIIVWIMGVSYNRLWKMLIDKNMKRVEMQYLAGISGNILARMGKNKYVSMETVEKICKKMDCTIDEMMEFTDDENSTPDTA